MIPTKAEWENALTERHGAELQKKLANATVAVCGLGGLGSNIAVMLARAGVGKLILTDFDRVDIANLNRQQYKAEQIGMYKTEALLSNLKEIAPYLETEINTVKLNEQNISQILSGADIICEAFDSAEAKAMLVNTVLEIFPDKYLVAASGMAGLGSANAVKTKKITDKFYLCGDGESAVESGLPLFSSRAALCAAHQAHTVLRIIAGKTDV